MTKALAYAIKNNLSDLELLTLLGHKNLSTAKHSYIDWKLEEMLEATYGLDLSVSDYMNKRFNVADRHTAFANNEYTCVENGCGNCTAPECTLSTTLPCLLCEHFVTTTEHQPYFERAIEAIDAQIKTCTGSQHDIEDLQAMKRLYVLYLKQIIEKKEGIEDE